jgi:hypothetical protein
MAKKVAVRSKSSEGWKSYRVARNTASSQITKAKKAYFSKKFRNKVSSQCLWDTVNEFTGFRKEEKNPISVLDPNGTSIRINDLFADEFTVVPKKLSNYESLSNTVVEY